MHPKPLLRGAELSKGLEMKHMLKRFINDEEGATAIEYGLIAALVALAGIVAFTQLGDSVEAAFLAIADELDAAVAVE